MVIIIIGLGNPGKKYTHTRHNIGFRVINKFKEINNFPDFKLSKKFNSLFSEGFINSKKIILAKPQTFMNNSGRAVKALTNFYKSTRSGLAERPNLVVIHDDIDLPLGKIKIAENRGAAGHKGVESIIKEIGAKDFIRIRIGIQHKKEKPRNIEQFVLQKFRKEEKKLIKKIIENTVKAIGLTLKKGIEKAMSEYNE